MEYSRIKKRKDKKRKNSWMMAAMIVLFLAAAATYYFTLYEQQESTKEAAEPVENTEQQTTTEPKPELEPKPKEPVVEEPTVDEAGYAIVTVPVSEPTKIDGIVIANKKYPLPQDYNPGENPTALNAYKKMEAAAKQAGFKITAFSGFRSYDYQKTLYDKYVARDGQAKADRYSARPGHSEHQTGLAFDIGEIGREDLWLTEAFGETAAGQWLVNNAHKYGFILRYPKGKESITGFMYESWHFRYVGAETAAQIYSADVTLEEFLNID